MAPEAFGAAGTGEQHEDFAAVAAAATLGVTEPYSAGIGGGGYFVFYNAKSGKVRTLDGRETAPMKMPQDAFIDPATGKPYTFTPDLVTGVWVGYDNADGKRRTLGRGVEYLLRAQYPNGAWPQGYEAFPDPAKFPVRRAAFPQSVPGH